jgi:Tfp pilus assembly protein PilO
VKKNVSLKLPKPAQFALVGVGTVLVLLMGWMILLGPKQKQISNLNAQTAQVNQQIADDLTRTATARNSSGAPTIKVADVYKLTTAMPSIPDMPDLLLELDQTAKAAGVSLDSISPGQPAPTTNGYSTIAVSLAATGNFYTLTDLLYRLRNLVYVRSGALQANGRIFDIGMVSLTPSDTSISAQITLTTYVYGSTASSPTAPGAITSTTTSTSTTTTTSSTGPSAAGATP